MATSPEAGRGPTIIEPVEFRNDRGPARRRRPLRRWLLLFFGVLIAGVLLASGWLVLTAREVELTFDPAPETMELSGPPLRLEFGERLLLGPGTYTVYALREGYFPLEESFTIERGGETRFHFSFAERPGVITLRCIDANDPNIVPDDVVARLDDREPQSMPLMQIELERGIHALRLTSERYQDVEMEIEVEGLGHHQGITLALRPDWATVEVASAPVSAELWIDGQAVASTPCQIDLLSGSHQLELKADGFEVWQRRLDIVAGEPVSITDIVLAPARGRLLVETEPAGAQVTVGGEYAGVSPIEVLTEPNRELLVQVARPGYEAAEGTVQLAPQESATISFELTPQFGTVLLEIDPSDATLMVDGTPWEPLPSELTLPAVEHQLRFEKDGFEPLERTIKPRPGVLQRIVVQLQPVKAAAAEKKQEKVTAANGYELALIQPSTYVMGASRREQGRRSNETLRTIEMRRPFYLGVREVTNAEFRAFKRDHDSGTAEELPLNGQDRPAVNVSWDDVARFCNWLSLRDQLPPAYVEVDSGMQAVDPMTIGYRLPTEAEWEFVARANGTDPLLRYPWGETYPPRTKSGNFADQSASRILALVIPDYDDGFAGPAPVGSFPANAFGIQDLGGNVAEWCHDFYSIPTYDAGKVTVDPLGPTSGRHHVVRGSSWRDSSISTLRFSYRNYGEEERDDLGFRICRYAANEEPSK